MSDNLLDIYFKVGENWQKTNSIKSRTLQQTLCLLCFCIRVTCWHVHLFESEWIDLWDDVSQSRFWPVEHERNDSNVDLQRGQVIDTVFFFSFCTEDTVWCNTCVYVCVCVYFCRYLVLFSAFPQNCSKIVFRVRIAVSDWSTWSVELLLFCWQCLSSVLFYTFSAIIFHLLIERERDLLLGSRTDSV